MRAVRREISETIRNLKHVLSWLLELEERIRKTMDTVERNSSNRNVAAMNPPLSHALEKVVTAKELVGYVAELLEKTVWGGTTPEIEYAIMFAVNAYYALVGVDPVIAAMYADAISPLLPHRGNKPTSLEMIETIRSLREKAEREFRETTQ